MDYRKVIIVSSIIIGIATIISVAIGGFVAYQIRVSNDSIVVTDSAKERVTADTVKWVSSFSRTVGINDLKLGFSQLQTDHEKVAAFLAQNGLATTSYEFSSVFVQEPYKYDANAPKQYTVSQTVVVNANDVNKITQIAKDTNALINQGVVFTTMSLEYYYSKLPELRMQLVAKAIEDAKERAKIVAEHSARTLGVIKSVSQGVVQVLAPNSVDVSDYGTYDTSTIEKDVTVTARLTIGLK